MTRDEEIIAEAKKYYSDSINCHNAFLHGVEWADEHPAKVWHEAKEEPEYYPPQIICQDKSGLCWTTSKKEIWEWQTYVDAFQVVRWAYINDLLPKEE